MISLIIGALLSAQTGPGAAFVRPPGPPVLGCRLIAANGEVIGLDLQTRTREGGLEVRIGPAAGSPWPMAASAYLPPRKAGAKTAYRIEQDGGSLLFNLGITYPGMDWQSADLEELRGDDAGLPLAVGYCAAAPVPAVPQSTAAARSANFRDPASWLGECALMTRDGRLSRFRYSYQGRGGVIEPLDKVVWQEKRLEVPRLSPSVPPRAGSLFRGFATSRGEGGLPDFAEFVTVDEAAGRAVLRIKFHDVNAGPAAAGDMAFAICGINDLDRIR